MQRFHKLLVGICLGTTCAAASALDLVWDGKNYLDIGLQLGADSTLVFPEPVKMSAENEGAFEHAESSTDPRVVSIRPNAPQEQRVTFIGTKSKTIYLARFSTRAAYSPIYRIKDRLAVDAALAASTSQLTPTTLMRMMMAGTAVNGVSTRKHVQAFISGPEYKISAVELWETPTMTGVVGTATLHQEIVEATIRPSDISLKVPALGQVRLMGADRFELNPDVRSTAVYFVFTR